MKTQLICHCPITDNFVKIAKYKKYLDRVQKGEVKPHRVDCYPLDINIDEIYDFFQNNGQPIPKNIELFSPSSNYPPHIDGEGISYFIPLKDGEFQIEGVIYKITPFVLYSFDDCCMHNTNFPAIMIS